MKYRIPCILAIVLLPSWALGFLTAGSYLNDPVGKELMTSRRLTDPLVRIGLSSSSSEPQGDDKDEVVTKEMFLRDILEPESGVDLEDAVKKDVSVRKKQGKKRTKEYKVLDNRDILPFRVTLDTPDPYTHPEVKKKNAAKTRKHGNAVEEHLIKSTLYKENSSKKGGNEEESNTLLGEFQLGKDTTTGDVLLIGNAEYKVIRHRCQYKYAGAQRFVMVRKILEVKEVGRMLSESALKRQWKQETTQHPLGNDSSSQSQS